MTLKRHGGWRSSTVADGYVDESIGNKRKIGKIISDQIVCADNIIEPIPSTSSIHQLAKIEQNNNNNSVITEINEKKQINNNENIVKEFLKEMQFNNCSNININFK